MLRKRGVYLAMLTLALSQVFYYIVLMWTPVTGGTDGLGNLPILYLSEPLGWRLSKRPITRYYVIAAIIFVAMLAIRHLLRSPLGRVMRAVKANETRAAACGYDTRRVRLVAFAISGLFSGLAGALLTVVLEFVPIENIHWQMSGTVLIMTLFGGTGTLLGPFVGAGVFIWMRDFLSKHLEYWEVFVGGTLRAHRAVLPRRHRGHASPGSPAAAAPLPAGATEDRLPSPSGWRVRAPARGRRRRALLESRGLTKAFGGLTAVNRVDFQVRRGRAALGHRPQRRGQDDVLQPPHRRAAPVGRAHPVQGRRTSPGCPPTPSRASASRAPTRSRTSSATSPCSRTSASPPSRASPTTASGATPTGSPR